MAETISVRPTDRSHPFRVRRDRGPSPRGDPGCTPGGRSGPVPMILGTGAGVLTDRAEHEGKSAVAGLVFRGGGAEALGVPFETHVDEEGRHVAHVVDTRSPEAPAPPFSWRTRSTFRITCSMPWSHLRDRIAVVGGGTLPGGAWYAPADGRPERVALAALVVRGHARPAMRACPGSAGARSSRPHHGGEGGDGPQRGGQTGPHRPVGRDPETARAPAGAGRAVAGRRHGSSWCAAFAASILREAASWSPTRWSRAWRMGFGVCDGGRRLYRVREQRP